MQFGQLKRRDGDRRIRARDADDPHSLCNRLGPGRLRLRSEPDPPGRQHHWLQQPSSGNGEQVAGVAH
jgi:hypothetical protein